MRPQASARILADRACLHPNSAARSQVHRPRLVNCAYLTLNNAIHASHRRIVCRSMRESLLRATTGANTVPNASAENEQSSAGSENLVVIDELPLSDVKSNGSSIVPQNGDGDNNGNGNGSGGSDDGRGRSGDGSSGDAPDNKTKALLLLLSVVVGASGLYGVYQLVTALPRLVGRRQAVQPTTSRQLEPHDDIAALKRLLREVFTNQIQMERRVSALEPEDTVASFDPLERSRKGWGSLSGTGKARVELSGNLVMGSALLYSKDQDHDRAARSLDQTGASTSSQIMLNIKTDLGGAESGGLRAQCMLDAGIEKVSLQKVVYESQPRQDMNLYLAPVGGQAADAVMTLNAQAGAGAHSLLQLSANPLSGFCCAMVATRSSPATGTLLGPSGGESSSSNNSQHCSLPAAQNPGQTGVDGSSKQNGADQDAVPSAASTSSAWWTFQGCKGPWSRQHQDNSNNGIPGRQGQTAASAALPHYGLGVTGLWQWCEELAVSGWAATGQAGPGGSRGPSWGVTLSSYPDGTGDAWALALRRSTDAVTTGQSGSTCGFEAELSIQRAMADGLVFTPGLIYARGPRHNLAALCCRSEWHF